MLSRKSDRIEDLGWSERRKYMRFDRRLYEIGYERRLQTVGWAVTKMDLAASSLADSSLIYN